MKRFAFAVSLGIVPSLAIAAAPSPPTWAPRTDCAVVEAVLTPEGRVKSARITRSAGADFDRRALAFVKARRHKVSKGNKRVLYLSVAVCPHELR